jgi:hypothetical protein
MVNVTRSCKAFTNVPGAALVELEKIMPSNALAKPESESVCVAPVVGTVTWKPLLRIPWRYEMLMLLAIV